MCDPTQHRASGVRDAGRVNALARQGEAGFGVAKDGNGGRDSASSQTRPKTRVVLAASPGTPVCFRAVRALTRGGVDTRAQSISRNYRICARSRASASGIRLALPLAVAAIDLAKLLANVFV